MTRFLKTDIASRIIAFALAVVVWIYVVILLDPPINVTYNDIPVLYTNTVSLTNEGFVLTNEKSDTVSIKVRGPRTMHAKINKSEIMAFVDLDGYSQTGLISIPISVRLPVGELSVIEKKPYGINVTVDKIITQSFPVTAELTGVPQEGFEVYESFVSQSAVELSGPSELVASIEKVVASVDLSGVKDDLIVTRELNFYNTNQDIVSSKHLASSPEKLEIRCTILKNKAVAVIPVLKDDDLGFSATVIPTNQIMILGREGEVEGINEVYTKPIALPASFSGGKVSALLDLPQGIAVKDDKNEVTVEIK